MMRLARHAGTCDPLGVAHLQLDPRQGGAHRTWLAGAQHRAQRGQARAGFGLAVHQEESRIGQEATHRRIHALFNAQIEKHGLVNAWEPRARKRMQLMAGLDPRHALAITAANEHFTALFADWLLARPEVLAGAEPRLQTLWLWHSAEESEHKCTAFDLYQALGGSHAWRVTWMRRVTLIFLTDTLRQTAANLRRDGSLWRWSTWRSAGRHLLGRDGLLRVSFAPWRAYFRPDFHPAQQHSDLSERWLQAHADLLAPVGASSVAGAT